MLLLCEPKASPKTTDFGTIFKINLRLVPKSQFSLEVVVVENQPKCVYLENQAVDSWGHILKFVIRKFKLPYYIEHFDIMIKPIDNR